ncbi:MAG TPA: cytochrome c oxidase subunit II [Terriglobia bacterium]|jgi:cytochrome c oxidase subunit 2|nr:cytochrome c oxidase subunit II [Terriglobia bacterium]
MAALALAVLVALITIVSVAIFWGHYWWFPVDISTHGAAMDHQFNLTLIICGVVFIASQLGLAWFVWKYRDRGDGRKAAYYHGNNALEATWTTAAAIVFIGLNLLGYRIWAQTRFTGPSPGALRIEVWAEQFQWYFRYPGPDGEFGPSHPEKMNDAIGNYLGLDREHDQASKDDIVTATLGIPANREVELILRSKDVDHSFYCRELRVHQDVVPGMEIPVHFTTTDEALKHGEGGTPGRYEIVCTQLCGLGHYKMRAFLQVMPEQEFEKWLQQQAAMQ